jgi:hypothetical protein
MKNDQILRQELLAFLKGGNAHMSFTEAVADFPMKDINTKVPNGSYTVWHLLEHMRIAQWDILGFVINPRHQSPEFPGGYWPGVEEKASPEQWKKTIKGFLTDLKAMVKLVTDPQTDFFSPLPQARDYTILREVLLAADHNAYHLGELVGLRRVLHLKPIKEY